MEISRRSALKWRGGAMHAELESLAVEEPLEIRLLGKRLAVTMRTPGHDEELAAGFLFAEGFFNSCEELGEVRRAAGRKGEPDPNAVDVTLKIPATDLRQRLRRNFVISSSCGICGKASIESIQRRISPLRDTAVILAADLVRLAPQMRDAQAVFAATGGLHAAGLFDLSGKLKVIREDVGRNNAVDKVIGHWVIAGRIPLADGALMVSGRASFEIVQKAAAAGIPIVAAVSAPSSLAVELAEDVGITLVGFMRGPGFNVYAHPERIAH